MPVKIAVQGIAKSYALDGGGSRPVIAGIDFTVDEGEFVASV